ncbi:MAG: hypothetical protein H6709_02230 [Kofleriaceae bacterium]|nr:hypothetical protein [Myxococcales bacterium]MCB9570889.1 hypothetical protein [Kofleriaceae bacterium]
MRRFNPSTSQRARAVQAWQILVGRATNRQTLTYKGLSELMYGKPAAGVLNEILGHVAYYCIDNALPPLTAIVVNTGGVPGHGIPIDQSTIDAQREAVFAHDWYDVYPPSEDELASAFARPR